MEMEKLVSLCKRRGFIYQASEIYGGINGFWDYGPLGTELKRNIKEAWWHDMVRNPPPGPDGQEITMVGLDTALIQNPKVWEASGHATGFQDPMISCKTEGCKGLFRADQLASMQCPLKPSKAPGAFERCQLTEARAFNLMFKTFVGAVEDAAAQAWLRPETAQGIFINFKNVLDSTRVKLPFGIAQIGKAFRNEINPRNYTFRSREFEQMEIEFFCHPQTSRDWYRYWRDRRYRWYVDLGLSSEKLRLREHDAAELAHYSVGTADIEYAFPFLPPGKFGELEGVAHRADFDLRSHMEGKLVKQGDQLVVEMGPDGKPKHKGSGKDLSYFDEVTRERYVPHVIEPSAGADRAALAFLCEAYTEDTAPDEHGKPQSRTVLRFHPRLAPIKAAILPLVNKDGMPERALSLYRQLKPDFAVFYDDKGAIGRRYRRQDEAGTPWCITIDGQTLQDDTVTLRDRDSLKQERIKMDQVGDELRRRLKA